MPSGIAAVIPVLSQVDVVDPTYGQSDVAEFEPLAPAPEPELSLEDQLAEAYQRGRLDAGEELKDAFETERMRLKRAADAEMETFRISFEDDLAAKVSADLEAAFAALEMKLSASVARCLDPLLDDALVAHVVAGFEEALRQVWSGEEGRALKISGPQSLLERLEASLGADAGRVQLEVAARTELTACLDDTVISTRLSDWQMHLQSARETR
ncbi:hypothetical protein GCM10011316_35120 [Roseibium aquae]|uniref:Flagellar assembly protein FliH n=1 Tax=Roseibium aquae TaxID=1323746 RepID=A0A916TMB4_9HYPH|nr:hypothetical protein [Roseibium aquae]GGB60074.1 hypothetical protein GCM10011316_35120 [Roseibium aquae]